MQKDEGTSSRNRAPNNGCRQTLNHTQLRGHGHKLSRADQVSDPTQQFTLTDRSIRLRHGIAPSNPLRILAVFYSGDYAMGTQPAIAPNQHHVSNTDLIRVSALNHQRIPGPDRWQHAPARRPKTKIAKRTQNFARQIALHCGSSIGRDDVGVTHDSFVGCNAHWPSVPVLPHVSAEVTKTCSYRKPGFS